VSRRTDWFRALGRPRAGGPLIIAHRGDSFHAPENTLDAAERGWKAGAHAWELDVHLTRDGAAVVIHDESLVRTTDVARRFCGDPRGESGFRVADFDLYEIRTLDAGSWFVDPCGGPRSAAGFGTLGRLDAASRVRFASGAVRVPTLAEALTLTRELDWLVNIELKSFPDAQPDLLDAVLQVVGATDTAGRILVSSFDHADVARCARIRPDLPTGVLSATPLLAPERYVREHVGAVAYHPSADALNASSRAYRRTPAPETLRRADLGALHDAGVPVLVFTVNDSAPDGLAAHLAAAGVDGLFTDDPAGLAPFGMHD
jgi:glycerophosphoryl diester phosphodiesterase